MAKKTKPMQSLQLAVINPCSAAIDVGSMMMMISYSDSGGNQIYWRLMPLPKAFKV